MPLFWIGLAANWQRVTLCIIGAALLAIGIVIEFRRQHVTGETTEWERIYLHAPGAGCMLAGAWLLATASV